MFDHVDLTDLPGLGLLPSRPIPVYLSYPAWEVPYLALPAITSIMKPYPTVILANKGQQQLKYRFSFC